MKLAVLSDIHGNLIALEAALADLNTVGPVDTIWCLGDLAAFGPRPVECIHRVRELRESFGQDHVHIIGGNTDRYLVTGERFRTQPVKDEEAFKKLHAARVAVDTLIDWGLGKLSWEDYEFLAKILHQELSQDAKGYGPVIGYHAIPGDDEAMSLRPDSPDEEALDALLDREGRLGIGGHTHLQMDRNLGRWRAVNVGSVGLSFDQPGKAQWGLFTFEGGSVTVDLRAVPYDVDAALADANAIGHPLPSWIAARVQPKS